VHLFFRTVLHLLLSRRRGAVDVHDVAVMHLRVMPTDLDVLGHMNNGMYLSIMDLGRMDLLIRSGAWKRLRAKGWYPVMANETISFRKSLQPWQAYELQTKIVGYDAKAVFVEQRFVVAGEIYASSTTRGRFLKKTGGTVSLAELADMLEIDTSGHEPAPWITAWVQNVALPTTREPAPSDWA
jgi:acyl-CoA thioesterase FadM